MEQSGDDNMDRIIFSTSSDSDDQNSNDDGNEKKSIHHFERDIYTTEDSSDVPYSRYKCSRPLSSSSSRLSNKRNFKRPALSSHHVKQRINLELSSDRLQYAIDKALNDMCHVQIHRLTKIDVSRLLRPLAHLSKIPRINKSSNLREHSKKIQEKTCNIIVSLSSSCSSTIIIHSHDTFVSKLKNNEENIQNCTINKNLNDINHCNSNITNETDHNQ